MKDNKNEMMKDREEEILFDFENREEENIISKARSKSYIKIISISIASTALILVVIIASKLQLAPYVVHNKILEIESYNDVVGANTFLGPWDEQNKIFKSGATATRYKLIGNKPVYMGTVDINKVDYEDQLITENNGVYSYYGNKIMEFYHPFVEYNKYSNDLNNIDNIDANKNIEMGLSFDKQYSLQEIESILPKSISINWLWVDTIKGDQLESIKKLDNGTTKIDAQVLMQDQVVGFSNIEEDGAFKDNPIDDFIEDLEFGIKKGGKYKKDIEQIYNSIAENNESIDKNSIKIIGAVVVGDKESLSQLKSIDIIKSSSMGVTNNKY